MDFIPATLNDTSDWPHIEQLPLARMSDVLLHVRELDPCESRGVIVVDLDSGLRYKLISKKSSMLAKFMFTSEARAKEILETIVYNDKNDAYQSDSLQHIRPQFEKVLGVFENAVAKIEKELEGSKQLSNRDLARRMRSIASGEIILTCRSKGLTVREAIKRLNTTVAIRGLKELFKVDGLPLENQYEENEAKPAEENEDPEEPHEDDTVSFDEYNMM